MAIEIERKFLVKNEGWRGSIISSSVLKQGYLANQNNASVRVRIAHGKAHLNIKSKTLGIRRSEYEYQIPVEDAEEMLQHLAEQPVISKTRYLVQYAEHVWELDVFDGENSGLVVAEIELKSEQETFALPDWAGEEVSGDPKYYNINLVKHPFSKW